MKETSYTYNVLIVLVFVMTMLFGTVPASAQTSYWTDKGNYNATGFSGDGTEASPYEIWTAEDLARLAYDVNYDNKRYENVYFVQRADVDLSEHLWEPIGRDASKTFMGHYAGQGHKITNMTINETYLNNYPSAEKSAVPGYGLFGSVNGHSSYASYTPVIQNVVLVSPSITINTAGFNKYTRIGLLVGALGNNSTLKNCNVQGGKIVINNLNGLTASANMFIGGAIGDCAPGFAGYSTNSVPVTIKNISVDADITVTPTSTTSNVGNYQYNAAGIVGRMRYSRGPLDNCFYTGKIDAPQFMVSPSYGAIRNTNSTVTAENYAGKFYDASEKNGTKVYFGNYQVMYKGNYRTITPNNSGGYDFSPAEGTVSTLTKSDPASTPAGLSVWTFGSCTGTFTSDMYRTQGVNSCDKYVSSSTTFSYSNLVDAFNSGISSDNIMRYHWSNHEGKLLLERLDDATLKYNKSPKSLTLDFTAPAGATNITYHWRRGAEEVHSGTTDADKTYNLPAHILTDITWHAYASYVIGTKTYYSSVPEYTQVADATMPSITITGNRTNNTLALTTALTDPNNVTTGGVTYHWTKDGVVQNGITTASTNVTAFTPENVEWQVYATFTHEGTTYQTNPVTYIQEPPKMTYEVNDDGTDLTFALGFDNYGGALTDVKYVWDVYNYDADGNPQPDTKTVLDSNTHSVPSLTFEEKVWHAYVTYKYESQDYQTASERYLQAATALPTLSVNKVEDSGTQQLTMTASLTPDYGAKLTNIKYHWSKNAVEQTDHYSSLRTVPHAFDTQFWRCWVTFEHGGKEYRTNDDTYTYYSTLGHLNFHADLQPNRTILATLDEADRIAENVTIAYTWSDSHGHTGDGNTFDYAAHQDAAWVEFKATITDRTDANNILVKYAYHSFDIEHDVVYINYNTGGTTPGNDANDGRTPQTPVKTWKRAYALLNGTSWDQNIIVIVNQGASASRMTITEGDTGDKPATITGRWPWVDDEPLKASAVTTAIGRIYMDATTGTSGTRIGAPTRFKDVVFYAMGSTSQNRISCFLHDTYFDTGVVMQGFADLEANAGAIEGRKSPHFHLQLYADQLANDNFPQATDKRMTLTIKSGQFGRILASRIAGTKAKNTYIIGRHNNPLKATINIDIKDQDNAKGLNGAGNVVEYTDDIGYLASGLTQGMMWGDFQINVTGGKIATLVAASQGNALKMGDLKVPVSTFCGRTTVNINGDSNGAVVIQNYYGGCQGRVYGSDGVCDAYFYGKSTLNMTFGTIESDVFASSAGISGLRSADPAYFEKKWFTPDQRIPYPEVTAGKGYAYGIDYLPFDPNKQIVTMTTVGGETIDLSDTEIVFNIKGGLLRQNIYGGSYGYSDPLNNVDYAPAHAGRLFGNTSVNISGGTIQGNVYGGGSGSSCYFDMATTPARREDFLHVAQVYGNTHVNITGNPSILGNIYGGGGGVPYQDASAGKTENEFLDIAKVIGSTNVTIDTNPEWEYRGNIYGGGAMGAVDGTTTVSIKSGTILGNVFGGGKGEAGHADKAKTLGDTKLLIGDHPEAHVVQIFGNVYGGGELAQVVSPDDSLDEVLVEDKDLNDGPQGLFNPAAHHRYTTYVHLGDDAEVYGQSFGGGKGDNDGAGETLGRVIGQTDIVLDGATVWSEIYGGGQMADVRGNTLLHFKKGKAGHNAFGGGLGVLGKRDNENLVPLGPTDKDPDNRYEPLASADVRFIGTMDGYGVMNDVMRTDLPATGNTFVVFDGSEDSYTHYEFMEKRKIHYDSEGKVAKNDEGNYFDCSKQYDEESSGQYFSIDHNIYGGGMTASNVEGNTYVHIRYGMVNKDMLEWTGYGRDVQPVWSKVFKSIADAQFCVFGGGYGYWSEIKNNTYVTMDVAGSGGYKYISEFTEWFATTGKDKYHWDTNTGTPENIYKAADEATWSHGAPGRSAMDIIGGGYNGKVLGTTHVETSGDLVVRKVYGGGYYASVGNSEVTLKSGIYERVYGGGMIGNVYGTATLNFGQHGITEEINSENLHLMVKDAVYGGNDVSGTVGTTPPGSKTHTLYGVTYNVYDPVDDDSHGVRLNMYGGLVLGDVYGAGNGNHPGYTNPAHMDFDLSQHPAENYRKVIEPGQDAITNDHFAYVYKYRPRTARVVMNIVGNDGTDFNDDPQVDKVRIWGRTFGGGNSCNVGIWDGMQDDNAEVYADDATSWHPGDNFSGAGTIQINIGDHVQLGNRNDSHTTPNGLFMGSNGEHMVTQTTDPSQLENYHHFYHPSLKKYLPGFLVYDAGGNVISRKAGLKAFSVFINNILTWTDNVNLTIANDAQDVWMSNFVGGGYRGSMKAKSAEKQFAYTLPTGVTIGHSVVGGAFNAHIVYRIYMSDSEGWKQEDGKYVFQTTVPSGWKSYAEDSENCSYLKALYEDPDNPEQITGILRYNFDGGIMGHKSGSIAVANGARCGQVKGTGDDEAFDFTGTKKYDKDKALVYLNLRNKLDPIVTEAHDEEPAVVHGGIVYGGCFHSGYIDGDVWVDYRCSLSPLCKGKDARFFDKTNDEIYGHVDNLEVHNALNVFGAGYGEDTHTMGDTYLRVLHNGTSDDSYDYPLVYNVFGGGNMGTVAGNTNVYYNVGTKGTVMGSLYGGGYKGTIDGNTFVELAGGLLINAYGGSREANIGGATHVWAYDGANRPDGEDETSPEKAPLLIGNIYGGNDISGTIGTDDNGMEATWTKQKWTDLEGKLFNSYVQVGGTETIRYGYPLIGNVFAGGNGEKTAVGVPAPNIAKTLLEIDGGTTLRAFGGGNKATVTKDAYIFVDAPEDVFTNYTFTDYQKKVLMQTVFKGVLNGYHWDESTLVMDPYHVVKMYGGNNVATMDIQPKWNLKDGLLENVYSGGNMGDMTYYNELGTAATKDGLTTTTAIGIENNADGTNANYTPRGLSITINSPNINIKNLFGGCRLSNVVPGGYAIDPETGGYVIDPETQKPVLAMRSAFDACENLFGATINILNGNIENVYGGNDVGGKVYYGTNINISGGVLGNVYGSGNGDYLYRFDSKATDVTEQIDDELGFYYDVPEKMGETLIETAGTVGSDTHKILTINRIRPAVDKTFINIGGMAPKAAVGDTPAVLKRVAAVKGNIFMGGNATTITRDGTYTFGKFKLGSYSTINGLFLGSDGQSYTQNEFIEQFAKLNGISDMGAGTDFNDGHELDKQHNPILLNAYLMAVDVQSPPKDFTIKESSLTEAYLGTFCGGGNRGSMLHDKTVQMDFPEDLVIYDKIVGGCMDAAVNYNQGGTTIKSEGGYTRALTDNGLNGNTKIRYNIHSQFRPLVMDADFSNGTTNKHGDDLATAMGKGFVYDNLNAGGNAWMTGCNIYGGCYESGVVVGDVELNLTSSLLGHMANDGMDIFKGSVSDGMDDGVTNKSARTKFDNALAYGQVIGNIYGAGFGQESDVQGNVRINIFTPSTSTPGNPIHPSSNNVYGGGRSGQLHGNSYIRLTDGHVYNDVVGGCDAATMYGSTYIGIGYPTYYKCNTTGGYSLTRGDQWNSDKIKQTVYYKEGDFIAPNVYEQITDGEKASKFEAQNEMTGMSTDIWNKTDIIVRGGVYGGGFTVASSTTGMAGNYTVLRELDGSGDKTNYGGNSTILVADRGSWGDGDHIRISTLLAKAVTFTQAQIDAGATTIGLFSLADKKFTHLPDGSPTTGTTYYDLTGDGGIYGDGHLTFCEGFRAADISGYGYNTGTVQHPRLMNTFQRLDLVDVNDCCLMLQGAQDFATDQIDATVYSITRIDELRMNSSLDADAALARLSNDDGSDGTGFTTAKSRNYLGFFNSVHYLGAVVTNDDFMADNHKFHRADGAVVNDKTYRQKKVDYISAYTSAESPKSAEVENTFKQRNIGTARNVIGINNGYCLRIQNQYHEGTGASRIMKTYYGPIVGVAEVKLLTLTQGEGGGYVYADNVHADESNFLNTSGNFVFPGVTNGGNAQYIVDDCFQKHFGTPEAITTKNGDLDDVHYWYVEGNKYFYNTTLTGYTYQDAMTFNLIDNDPNVILSGMKNGSELNIKKIVWQSQHRNDYGCVLENSTPDKTDDYEFDIEVAGTDPDTPSNDWKADMPRYSAGSDVSPLTTGKTIKNNNLPQFNIKLQDNLNNSGDANYINHLDESEQVKIYLVGHEGDQDYEYTITLNIIYMQGPTYTGGVDILNCALPGERIGFSTDGITIKTPDLMPITATTWKKLPLQSKTDGIYTWNTASGTEIPSTMYNADLNGGVTGSIPALYSENEYNIAFIFTAGGHDFPVMPSTTKERKEQRMIVVHNYHRMKDIVVRDIETSVVSGARVYIKDVEDLEKFVEWVNAGKLTAGVNFILQNDITLPSAFSFSNNFAGTFHGDGYHIDLNGKQETLFGAQLTGKVYNLGLINGTNIATTGEVINSYVYAVSDDYKYGKKAYNLSHYFTPTAEGGVTLYDPADSYVYKGYANGDYQYATTDRVWSLRTGEPNYGHTETRHITAHTHDAARWVDTDNDDTDNPDVLAHTGYNRPLHDGTATVADRFVPIGVGAEYITYHGLPVHYANDYLFFGQHIDKVNTDAYPVHINPIAMGDADATKGGNRVFTAVAYYGQTNSSKDRIYYNSDAWAFQVAQPLSIIIDSKQVLTSIDFTTRKLFGTIGDNFINEEDNCPVNLVAFHVDSNADYKADGSERSGEDAYSNLSYGHVTQNLMVVYEDSDPSKEVFATGSYGSDTPEEEIRYHAFKKESADLYTIPNLHLVDNQDFFASIDENHKVTGRTWYERLPLAYRNIPDAGYGYPSGWEGITLPFTVAKVEAEKNGEITHFYGATTTDMLNGSATNDRTVHHEYWLRGFTGISKPASENIASFERPALAAASPAPAGSTGCFESDAHNATKFDYNYVANSYFTDLFNYNNHYDTRDDEGADETGYHDHAWYSLPHTFTDYVPLTANVPYIIAFPGDDFYEFSMESYYKKDAYGSEKYNQKAIFEGVENTTFKKTVEAKTNITDVGTHTGVFTHKQETDKYVINRSVANEKPIGSCFLQGEVAYPFRTYMEAKAASSSKTRCIYIADTYGSTDDDINYDIEEEYGENDEPALPTLSIAIEGMIVTVTSTYNNVRNVNVFTPGGQLVLTHHAPSGISRFTLTQPGIYIIGGKKVLMR